MLLYFHPFKTWLAFCCFKWKMIDSSLSLQNVWKWIGGSIRAQGFPTIVLASLTGNASLSTHLAANLTICLLARSPTATSACTLNCCWRRTKKHCFPAKTTTTIDSAGLLTQAFHSALTGLMGFVQIKALGLSPHRGQGEKRQKVTELKAPSVILT